MIFNPTKRKAVYFTRAPETEPVKYSLQDTVIPEVRSYYFEIILRNYLSWADQGKIKPGKNFAF
jgi:hypothetical protein